MLRGFVAFFILFSFTLSGITFFLLRRRLNLGKRRSWQLFALFLFFAVMMVVAPLEYRYYQPQVETPAQAFQWIHFIWMGLLVTQMLVFGTFEVAQLLVRPFDPKKRIFLTEGVAKGLVLGSSLATVGGFIQANAGPEIHSVSITLPTLPKSFRGLTIAQISDVHIGPLLHKEFLERVVDQVMSLNADMIFITGDLVDGTVDQLKDQVQALKRLRAKDGIYFCTGNHEYYSGVEEWIAYLEELNIHVFKNTNLTLTRSGESGDEKILLAGVYDLKSNQAFPKHEHNPARASVTKDSVACKILLSHNPHGIEESVAAGFHLQFSGHTHAGQFAPFTFFMKLGLRYTEGLYQVSEHTQLYINRGTGYWGPPNRLMNRSEITKIVLT